MKLTIVTLLIFWIFAGCTTQNKRDAIWPATSAETKPWTRWWWMGSAVDEKNLDALLKSYSDAGFGGVEITPIYGVKGQEENFISYLSPEWINMLRFTVNSAEKYGMKVDMNLGTGWPFGGPQITPEHAATRLIIRKYSLKTGNRISDKIEPGGRSRKDLAELQAVTGYGPDNETIDLMEFVTTEGILDWSPKSGDWEIFAAFTARTNQQVKRAAPGGEGLTFDHFSKPALEAYLTRFNQAFGNTNMGVRSFFNDSYEVYGTNWTDNFFEEFELRRGYRLQNYLRELDTWPPETDLGHRVQTDYRETVSELLLENFTQPWTSWANRLGSHTKNQAHGSPGNLIDLYAAVDIPECETFGSSYFPIPGLRRDSADVRNVDPDPVMMKFATSAAHVTGKNLVSSETFTWLGEHFKTSLSQCKPEVEQVFLSGVNHVFYHGTTYSPVEAEWPGWLFYASVNFNPANSFWPHLPALNNYISRCQSILQTGQPDNELLIYWPLHDYWMNTVNQNIMLTIHDIDKWLHPYPFYKTAQSLSNQGFSYDFISDGLLDGFTVNNGILVSENGAGYKALIFPELTYLPLKTFQKAMELANAGANIIFQNIPEDVPGAGNLDTQRDEFNRLKEQLASDNSKANVSADLNITLSELNMLPESLIGTGLKFLRRKNKNDIFYYLVNHTPEIVDEYVKFNKTGRYFYILDPQTGNAGIAATHDGNGNREVRVQLRPGEALFVKVSNNAATIPYWSYFPQEGTKIEIAGPWSITFTNGGPQLPDTRQIEKLIPWTELNDSLANRFAGTAVYSTTFQVKGPINENTSLKLEKVYESARLFINGREAGFAWSFPFTIKIGHLLHERENKFEIEVANLPANRIRWMDRQKMEWRIFHEINFVNINYRPFDASNWEIMPSGLGGPVSIVEP